MEESSLTTSLSPTINLCVSTTHWPQMILLFIDSILDIPTPGSSKNGTKLDVDVHRRWVSEGCGLYYIVSDVHLTCIHIALLLENMVHS